MADEQRAVTVNMDPANEVVVFTSRAPLAIEEDVIAVPFDALDMVYLQVLHIRIQKRAGAIVPASGPLSHATPRIDHSNPHPGRIQ